MGTTMPLTVYHRFIVLGVVALCEQGLPIPPDSLTEVAAVSHETADDDDPNISAWGVYGVLFDQSIDNLADCPTKAIAEAIADALNIQYGRKAA